MKFQLTKLYLVSVIQIGWRLNYCKSTSTLCQLKAYAKLQSQAVLFAKFSKLYRVSYTVDLTLYGQYVTESDFQLFRGIQMFKLLIDDSGLSLSLLSPSDLLVLTSTKQSQNNQSFCPLK